MSTRAQVLVTDSDSSLLFYRHSDGYEKGTMPTLTKFLDLVKAGLLRDNVEQSCGWLILIGKDELFPSGEKVDACYAWKIGSYEPSTSLHGDIEYLYVVDLESKTISVHTKNFEAVLKKHNKAA